MTYTREQLTEKFGNVLGAKGEFNNNAKDTERLRNNKELKEAFIGSGRSEDDWNDDVSMDNDIDAAFRALGARNAKSAPNVAKPQTVQLSQRAAEAKAYTSAYEDEFLPNQGDFMIKNDQDVAKGFSDAYKLNLARELKPKNSDGSDRSSKVQEEKDKVAGIE